MRSKFLTGMLLSLAALFSACAPAGGMYYAAYAPPAPRYAVVGVAPAPGYVWTTGYWNRAGGSWARAGGRSQRPPHRNSVWVAAEWRRAGNGYRFYRGHWR